MSTWSDAPTSANKLRQSYLKGFLDVSGGGILVRADNSLNFYTTAGFGGNAAVSSFAIDATNIKVIDAGSGDLVSFGTNKLSYISDLNENVKAAFADIRSYLDGNSKSSNTDTEKLNVDTDAKIGGNLNVGGNAFFDQQVAIAGNLNIAQNLVTKGNGYFGGNLEVAGSQTINMNLYVKGDTFLNGRVFITQDASFHSNIACYGEITSAGTISTAVDLSANGALKVAGTSNLAGAATLGSTLAVASAATLSSTLAVTGASTFTGAVQANSTLTVTGAIQGNSTLTTTGAIQGNSTLTVTGAIQGNSTLTTTGAIQGNSTLAITSTSAFGGKATISSGGLEVTGATTLNSALTVLGAVDISNTLLVTGAVDMSNTLAVSGAIQGNSTLAIASTSAFGAKATISAGGLEVTGATKLNNALQVVQAVTMDSTLAVTGTSTFNDNITLLNTKKFTCGDLYIENDKIGATANDLVIDVVDGKKVHITGDLQIDGSFNFLGSITQTNVNINVTDELFITSDGPLPTMVALQNNNASDIAGFYYDSSASTPVMVIGKDNAVCVNKATATAGIAFDVSGASQFSGKMSLLNDLSLNGAAVISGTTDMKSLVTASAGLTVSSGNVGVTTGNVAVTAGTLTVTAGETNIYTLKVRHTSTFDNVATFSNGLIIASGYYIDQW
jgi:cytoskeletal protein CcmA (bactofilin family)